MWLWLWLWLLRLLRRGLTIGEIAPAIGRRAAAAAAWYRHRCHAGIAG